MAKVKSTFCEDNGHSFQPRTTAKNFNVEEVYCTRCAEVRVLESAAAKNLKPEGSTE